MSVESIKKTWPFICLGVPCGDRVHTPFMFSVWGIGRQYPGKQGFIMHHSSMITSARSLLAEAAESLGADYLLFLDSDMTFPQDTPQRLLAHNKDIVGATYVRRGPPYDLLGHAVDEKTAASTGLIEMTHLPTGCLLIKMSVFKDFVAPYFRFRFDEEKKFTHGEDFVFSEDARAKGYKLWCDMDLTRDIGHLFQYELKPEDAIRVREAEARQKAVANG